MINFKFILFFLMLPVFVGAQKNYVDEFNRLTDYNTMDDAKIILSEQLAQDLILDLKDPNFIIDSIGARQLKYVVSSDGFLSFVTWHYSLSDATSQYGGIIKCGDVVRALRFNDYPINADHQYGVDNWCGGIYYDIIPVEVKGEVLYTLLSWDGNNGVTSKKIIDVLSFDRKGRPVFGMSIFEKDRSVSKRAILEYASTSTMFLEYVAEQKGIVCNAVYVNDDRFNGISVYQSASDDFNVYRFEDSKWKYYSNVEFFMNKEESKLLRESSGRPSSGL